MSRRSLLIPSLSAALIVSGTALVPTALAEESAGARVRNPAAPNQQSSLIKKEKKKGKNKDKEKTVATVDAEWTVTESRELQGGTESQEILISVKNGKVRFDDDSDTRATGRADVKITYRGHFYTEDRSWHIGCDTEERTTTATFSERSLIDVAMSKSWVKDGVSERIGNGWTVWLDRPLEDLARSSVTTGFYLDWESLLQDKCASYPISDPLGWWAPSFVTEYSVTGKLNGGGKGVILNRPFTNRDQTATATGRIEFSESVEKRGTGRRSGGSLN